MSDRRRKGLLPGELEQMKREELSQKRRFRLLQVREQSKELASDIRKSVKKEKAKQLENLKEDLLREKQEEKENALQNLKQQYYENVSEIGSGWRAAQNQALIQEEQRVKTHLNNIAANERGQQALAEYWKENALKKESSKSAFQARKFALEVEKERAAYIASLPPPKPDPVDTLLQSSGKIKGVPDQKIMRTDINVEKANPEEEPDACEAAQLETDKQQQMESEKAKLQQKRGVQMKSRFREAWKKKVLDEEYSRTLKDIEDEERLARNEARQKYYSDENRYFMCSPLDKQIRKEKQAKAEDAFQKHFRAERDYEDNFDDEYSFHMIEKTEENAEITDYVEPLMRKPCTSLLETDLEEIDSCDDLVDELNIAYIESPEQKEAPKKLSEVEALSTLLVKLRKRRAELREEGERTLQLCLGVKSTEAGKLEEEEDEILLPKSVAVQAGKVSPPISTGIQTVPLEETDVQERLPSSTQEVQTDTQRKDTYVEAAVQADADFERHTVGSVTTVTTKESSSSTSYMSLPSQYGIPQFERLAQTECDICDVELSQTLQASKGKYEPSLVKQGTFAQPDVSRITSPSQDTVLPKITETKVTHSTATKSTSEFYHSEISSESLASYMKRIMRKYVPAGSDESGSETGVKTVFPPVDFLSTVKYVEPFSVVSPGKFAPSPDSEVPKIPTVISSPPDQLQTPDTYISKPIQTQMEEEQHGVSDQVLLDRDDSFASNLHVQSVAGEDICKGTVASGDETYNQLVLTQKMLLSQFHDTSSVDRDEAMAKELQECLLNLNIFKSRPPVKIHRVVPGEILMGHELSTIQEIDSLANGSSTGGLQNLSKSDIMSSSGIFQPLTPVSHLDSSVADHGTHLGESHDLSKSDIVSSSGTFQPLTPVSHLDSSVADHSRHLGQSHDLSIADIVSSSGTFQPLTPVSHLDSSVVDHSRHLGQSHDLHKSDIVSSSGTFQPLTPVSHLDSSVVDHSRHLRESHDLRLFPQTRPAQLYDVETTSQKDKERQLPYSVSGSTESFQPMSPASWQTSTDETKSDDSLSFVPSSSGPLHSLTVTEAENSHVAAHMPATSDVALLHPVETVVVKSEIIQTAERTKQVYSSKISDADTSAVTFHLLSSDHDSSLRSAQISVEKDDSEVSKFLCTQKLEVLQQAESTGSPLHPVVSSESGFEHSPAHSVRGIEYGETSSGPFQLISLKTDSSVDAKTLHSHSKQILHADTSSGSFQLMSATVEDSQVSSHTLPKIIVSDHSVPAMSIILEGIEQNHFGSSLQSHLASTKIQHPSVSGILTSTKRDGGELLASIAESPIIHDPQFSRVSLFHKPSTSDSGGSFHQTTSRLESNVSSFMAASNLKTEPDQVAERKKIVKYSSPVAQSVSLPSSPQKVTKMGKPLEANDQYGNFNQGSRPPNWAKMVLRRNTSSSSGSISSSQESLISAFTESKIAHQSTPVKAREVAVQGAGILEEPDLTLIGSEISCSLNVTPKKLPEVADDTLTEGSIASSSSFQSTAQEMPCSSVESLEQKRDPDSRSEVGHLSTVSDNMRTPVSDYSVVTSPVSASLLSFEKHEIEYAESDEGSPSVPSCSTHVEAHKELPNKNFSASSHRTASNFSQGPSSESSTPTTGTPKLYQQKSYTDYRSRTKRLWNNLAEVREKKLAEEKKQAFVKNREKVKELQMKIQKARKTATPKK